MFNHLLTWWSCSVCNVSWWCWFEEMQVEGVKPQCLPCFMAGGLYLPFYYSSRCLPSFYRPSSAEFGTKCSVRVESSSRRIHMSPGDRESHVKKVSKTTSLFFFEKLAVIQHWLDLLKYCAKVSNAEAMHPLDDSHPFRGCFCAEVLSYFLRLFCPPDQKSYSHNFYEWLIHPS